MKKLIFILLTGIILGCSQIEKTKAQTKKEKDYELIIISTANGKGNPNGGLKYSRISTIIKKAKRKYGEKNVLYLDGGGNFSGNELSEKTEGASSVTILNGVKLLATTLGKGDFKYDLEGIEKIKNKANFNIITTNIKKTNGKLFSEPYIIKKVGDKKIGIIGLVSPNIYNDLEVKDKEKISIESPIIFAKSAVRELKRKKVDLIIALSSLGNKEDEDWELTNKGIAKALREIDLIIDSGESKSKVSKVNQTWIISLGNKLSSIGISRVDLDIQEGKEIKIKNKLLGTKDLKNLKKKEIWISKNLYKVKKGDTLYSISKKNGIKIGDIISYNPKFKKTKTISVGESLIIPFFEEKQVEKLNEEKNIDLARAKEKKLIYIEEDKKIKELIEKIK